MTTWRNVRAGYATFIQATGTKSVWRNVTMLINKTGYGGAYWFYTGKDTLWWPALVMTAMKGRVPYTFVNRRETDYLLLKNGPVSWSRLVRT